MCSTKHKHKQKGNGGAKGKGKDNKNRRDQIIKKEMVREREMDGQGGGETKQGKPTMKCRFRTYMKSKRNLLFWRLCKAEPLKIRYISICHI